MSGPDDRHPMTGNQMDGNAEGGMERHQYDVVWIFDGWDGIRLGSVDKLPITSLPFAAHTDCIPDWYTPLLASSEKMISQ